MIITPKLFVDFVSDAISGKYPGVSNEYIASEVTGSYQRLLSRKTLRELMAECCEPLSAKEDISNQVIALLAIANHFEDIEFREHPMLLLHRIAYAQESIDSLRSTPEVEGFRGKLPTPVAETNARFDELEAMIRTLALMPVHSIDVVAPLLAHTFASTIRIHYFKDGNGRVARLTVQYLLKAWGRDFLALPKVRNDSVWASALKRAIDGDNESLTSVLVARLKESKGGT